MNHSEQLIGQVPKIGILMLNTNFPRILGDIGNEETWPFKVVYGIVEEGNVDSVIHKNENLLQAFIDKAKELIEQEGVIGIATSCGFLSIYQKGLANSLPVPVVSSSLMQVPIVNMTLPENKYAGIITISEKHITPAHLTNVGVPENTPIMGIENGKELNRVIVGDEKHLNKKLAEEDLVYAAKDLIKNNKEVGAIVLECTNMAPYATAIQAATSLPVYSIYTLLTWFHSSLIHKRF
jgi:Asp/Glu/hydantoin racemase